MGQIRRMLSNETRRSVVVSRPPHPGDLGWGGRAAWRPICRRIRLGRDVRGACRADRRRVCRARPHSSQGGVDRRAVTRP
jgi:hypothetical protein